MYIKVIGKDIEAFKGEDVILFGCGSCGIHALEEFEKVGAHIVGFCDNNKTLRGTAVKGYEVFLPEEIYHYTEAQIIITSTYEEEIVTQLKEMNIPNYYRIKLGVLKETLPKDLFHNKVLSDEEANQYIYDRLIDERPFFIGRLGSVELECLSHYLYFLNRKTSDKKGYPDNVKMMMNINAGFFPTEDDRLDEFSLIYINGLEDLDLLWIMWFSRFEDMIYSEYNKEKILADYENTVFPIGRKNPWTAALKGKKVLVIHPFEASIQDNYKIRNELFPNENFIPDFELLTLKSVQSIAGNKTQYSTWFEALKDMETQMANLDFDIALIGAGAYGLPLGVYAKRLGKKAVHVGGILQLFFGIRGKAWDKLGIYNEYWTSPKDSEFPADYKKVEAGRYW